MSNDESSLRSSLVKIEQLRNEGLFKDAKELAMKTAQAWPDDIRVSRFIGMFFVAMNWHSEFEVAANMLQKSLPDFPEDADMHNLYSYACWLTGRRQEALKAALRAVAIAPAKTSGYLRLGMLYLTEGQNTEAYIALSAGIASCQNNTELLQWHKLAETLMRGITQVNLQFDGKPFTFGIGAHNSMAMTTSCYHLLGSLAEPQELCFLRQQLGKCDTIVECGILVGNHLIYFMKTLSPSKIIAFDADSWAIEETQRNIERNKDHDIATDIKLHHKAVGKTNGTITFKNRNIDCVALSDCVTDKVDFLKIDVDGMELDVIDGAIELIKRSQPKIMIEVDWENMPAFLDRMKDLNYTVLKQFDNKRFSNLFLVPQSA